MSSTRDVVPPLVEIEAFGVELPNVSICVHGVSGEQLAHALQDTPFQPISIASASDSQAVELPPDVDLMAFRHFVRSVIPGARLPDSGGHKTHIVQKALLPQLDYNMIADEIKQNGKWVMHARLRNAARDAAARHVLIPQVGDEHIFHHKTGRFSVNAVSLHFNPTFLFLEPGESIDVNIVFYNTDQRAKMCTYRPSFCRVISKDWLVARPDLAQRMWA